MSENNKPAITEQEKKRINRLAVGVIVCSLVTIAFVVLKFAGVLNFDAYLTSAGITLLLQSLMLWNTQRKVAIFVLCAGVFSILAFGITTFIQFLAH